MANALLLQRILPFMAPVKNQICRSFLNPLKKRRLRTTSQSKKCTLFFMKKVKKN